MLAAGRGLLLFALALAVFAASPRAASAQAVKGEVAATIENGFARLVFVLAEEVESEVRAANGVLIVNFRRPVELNLERLPVSAREFVSAARRDPDGRSIRIALARKATLSSTPAGERLFVDLLPETWSGPPPGLPREVIEELARRARDADKKLRQQQTLARQSKLTPIRVRVVKQPTFVRYVFVLPDATAVAANHAPDRVTLTFDALLKFDLADAVAALPKVIERIDSTVEGEAAIVHFALSGKADIRTFREDNNYIVDVDLTDGRQAQQDGTLRSDELAALAVETALRKNDPPAGIEAPKTMPARAPAVTGPASTAPARKPSEAESAPLAAPMLAAPRPGQPANSGQRRPRGGGIGNTPRCSTPPSSGRATTLRSDFRSRRPRPRRSSAVATHCGWYSTAKLRSRWRLWMPT